MNERFSRRDLLKAGAAAAATTWIARPTHATPTLGVARTLLGDVRGVVESGVHVFRGVPYGASTGGAQRFLAPRSAEPWAGVLETRRYAASCPQPQRSAGTAGRPSPISHIFTPLQPPTQDQTPPTPSEDCLALNVWTPGLDDAKRPVMVWLHGGGFRTGSGSSLLYDGVNVCGRGDVVLVTVNHRLGALGYLHLADLFGSELGVSGNAGMLDLILALEWVRDNVAAFGGDPDRVTIFGESGGGRKVSTLLGMPAARGLFHRAIIQSGPGLRMEARDKAHEMAVALLEVLGLEGGAGDLARLRALDAAAIVRAQGIVGSRQDGRSRQRGVISQRRFGPTVEGKYLPDYTFDPVASPLAADVPVLVGSNSHEMSLFLQSEPGVWDRSVTDAMLLERVEGLVGTSAGRVVDLYAQEYPKASATEKLLLITTHRTYWLDSVTLAQRKAAQSAPVWMYQFNWQTPALDGRLHSPHALEIPFAFDNLEHFPNIAPGDVAGEAQRLAARVSDAWIHFARTGDPGHAELPEWPRYDVKRRATMMFDRECVVSDDPQGRLRRLWATI